ncbi:UDP-N-acetylglucosamine--N-acetylmuramyl-(pentapeptide) pyrophosphoryl-undecaprenol N-acetylglucosamine transferase [Candidatus Gottesmanbacteria bacterium]|nr:UDP-N-acetylglucosamine--N-acetylmuramyl-(pentapeptide) pyrophosphoryl-undecaprenol N-acetylglucosamine transferase [Candidatus Gottesmanbacteria bacterium]
MDKKRIVICGGHLAPALAVIQILQCHKNYEIFYIGRKNAAEGDRTDSLEYLTLKELKIPFYSITSSRFQRSITRYTIPSLIKFPIALLQSYYFLYRIKPNIVLSFGGYIALPVCLAAYCLKIPVITHEQTHIMGFANRIISRFAQMACLSWSDTQKIPREARTVFIGNPIRKEIISSSAAKVPDFGNKKLPVIYITGGSLGSQSINKLIGEELSYLTKRFRIIHQCGSSNAEKDFKMLTRLKEVLPKESRKNYWLVCHVSPSEVGSILHCADLIICRSGANTVTEIAAVGTPAILLPLPWAADNEQNLNAKMLEKSGAAIIIHQEEMIKEELKENIELMIGNLSYYRQKARSLRKLIETDAARLLVEKVELYLS